MSQEKYIEYYVDILTKTMQDSIIKNVSLQANLRVTENSIKELQTKIEELTAVVDSTKKELESTKAIKNASDNTRIQQLQNEINVHTNTINTLRNQINELSVIKSEYESIKHQVQHIETFRNELSNTREELQNTRNAHALEIQVLKKEHETTVKELNEQIDYLKLTPAKRKKIDEAKATQSVLIDVEPEELVVSDEIIKDGGSF